MRRLGIVYYNQLAIRTSVGVRNLTQLTVRLQHHTAGSFDRFSEMTVGIRPMPVEKRFGCPEKGIVRPCVGDLTKSHLLTAFRTVHIDFPPWLWLCFHDQIVQLCLQARNLTVSGRIQIPEFIQSHADLGPGMGYGGHGLTDLIANSPIGEQAVKEEVRETEKPVDIDLHIGFDLDVCKFRFKPSEVSLKQGYKILGLIQVAVLCHMGDDATAAENIPGVPAVRTIQLRQDAVRRA